MKNQSVPQHLPLISAGDRTLPVTVQTRTALTPEQAFEAIVPIDLSLVFRGWGPFPGVDGVRDQTGDWDAAGQRRQPQLSDGSTAEERLTEYTRPSSFAYEITGFTNVMRLLVGGVRGEWTFSPDGTGTLIRWTYELKPRPGRHAILAVVVAPLWRRYMQRCVDGCARAAEQHSSPEPR